VLGIVTLAENEPDELATKFEGVVDKIVVSNFIVTLAPAAKPVPETATLVPTIPEVGEIVIAVTTTANVVDSVFVPSVADMM
jgi:hypothetical protein